MKQRKLLPGILNRVLWHQAAGEITIELVEEAPGKIDEVRETENTEEPG